LNESFIFSIQTSDRSSSEMVNSNVLADSDNRHSSSPARAPQSEAKDVRKYPSSTELRINTQRVLLEVVPG
jgi:hypothetical protein